MQMEKYVYWFDREIQRPVSYKTYWTEKRHVQIGDYQYQGGEKFSASSLTLWQNIN